MMYSDEDVTFGRMSTGMDTDTFFDSVPPRQALFTDEDAESVLAGELLVQAPPPRLSRPLLARRRVVAPPSTDNASLATDDDLNDDGTESAVARFRRGVDPFADEDDGGDVMLGDEGLVLLTPDEILGIAQGRRNPIGRLSLTQMGQLADLVVADHDHEITDEEPDVERGRASSHRGAAYLMAIDYPPWGSSSGLEGGLIEPEETIEVGAYRGLLWRRGRR